MNNLWMLADVAPNAPQTPPPLKAEPVGEQTATTAITSTPNGPAQTAPPKQGPAWPSFALMAVMFIVLYFMMFRGPRKKQQQQKQMIQALKKNDRVQTIGGMLGTVLDVKDDEVLVKVDENNNTKIWFITGAISRVLSEEKK
ncbi:MAG: preprotein translocase subunit YajC [Sedimentisphaerales bacterium]|nr:preprotein translocase subunit YajC [Sedimentisphaerales bacterium]